MPYFSPKHFFSPLHLTEQLIQVPPTQPLTQPIPGFLEMLTIYNCIIYITTKICIHVSRKRTIASLTNQTHSEVT